MRRVLWAQRAAVVLDDERRLPVRRPAVSDAAFFKWVIGSIAMAMLLGATCAWYVEVYDECRAEGHSESYCWKVLD